MADPEKLKRLSELDEKGLREDVLLPLLTRLGCKARPWVNGFSSNGRAIFASIPIRPGNNSYSTVPSSSAIPGRNSKKNSFLLFVMGRIPEEGMQGGVEPREHGGARPVSTSPHPSLQRVLYT